MEITALYFIILAVVSVFFFYTIKQRYRVPYLSLLSALFIASLSVNLLIYLVIFSAVNFLFGRQIFRARSKRVMLWTAVTINVLQLILLKYVDFTIAPIFQALNSTFEPDIFAKLIVPVGISYFTLQTIGYLVNIRMGWEKPEKNFIYFFLYIAFYPKFISGPIERSNHFIPQLYESTKFDRGNLTAGLRLILLGLFKKLIIANHLAPFVVASYTHADTLQFHNVLVLVLIQPLYLYFDFSGYTDIALGYARLHGIHLLPNFNRPFLSESITNFWRRFHISLSSWFNDYIFKILMFRLRKLKNIASLIALFVTWSLFGIWHGAGFNFMFLGLLFSIAMIYEYFTRRTRHKIFSGMPDILRTWMSRVITYVFYGTALIFFFSPDLQSTTSIFQSILDQSRLSAVNVPIIPLTIGILLSVIFLIYEVLQNDYNHLSRRLEKIWNSSRLLRYSVYYIIILLVLSEMNSTASFVYEMF